MRKPTTMLVLAAALGAALLAAPPLQAAHDNKPSPGPAMPQGMMGGQGPGGMMGMMQQMSEMMGHCNNMMSRHRSHGGEHKPAPTPGKSG